MSLKRRSLGLLGALVLVVSACGGSATPAPSAAASAAASAGASAAASAAPSAAAASSDFKFAVDGEPTYLSYAYTDLPTSWIVGLLYSGLYAPNNKLEILPYIADGLPTTSADGLTWTVKLKQGVKFHDGTVLTASDVKFTYDLGMSKNCTYIPDGCSSLQDNVASVTVTDPSTVVFVLKQKFAPFLVTGLGVSIIPEKAIRDSFARFQTAAGAVNATTVKALLDKIDKATSDKACGDKTPPASCALGTYQTDLEALLNQAKVQPPDQAGYQCSVTTTCAAGASGLDKDAYSTALRGQLVDLNTTLTSTAIDQIAASFRILDFQRNPVGTGPYKFVKYIAGQSVELARFDDYFGGAEKTKVGPAKVFIPIIKDAASASAALQKGDINWQTEITSDALSTLKKDPNLQIAEFADFGYYFIAFNLRAPHIYSDLALRQAFSMCIDHDATVTAATDGNGVPVEANTPPASWAYNADVPKYTLDTAAAMKLIEAAGWTKGSDGVFAKAGKRLSSDLYVRSGRPQRVAFARLAKDQLAKCGIEINVKESDFATVLLPLLSWPNKFDTYLGGWSTSIDPDDYSIFYSSKATSAATPDANNFVGWSNPAADKLLTDGRQELDQAKRKAIYAQFQVIAHNDLPYYFLWSDKAHAGVRKSVTSSTSGIDLSSPLYYWNNDSWVVAQ
jgi:ABC-type transport system substrate-binding protein